MNDDQYSERELTAVSAYLDGEATPDERALVEASPQLMAMVEDWGDLRGRTASVLVPAESRESAIAAALSVFDDLQAAPPVVTGNVVRLQRRRRQYRFMVGAAAAVAVVFGGLVLLQSGGSDEDSTAFEVSPKDSGAADDVVEPMIAADSAPADESATQMAPAPAASEAEASTGTDAPAATEAPAEVEAPADTEAPAPAGGSDPDALPVVDGPEQLSAYYAANRSVVPTTAPAGDVTTTRAVCPTGPDVVIGAVNFRGVPALVVISNDGRELRAIDASSCDVLIITAP